jgi:tRNA-Thr(GGU) m(6)t(6)A37 methyltransferase TsaA
MSATQPLAQPASEQAASPSGAASGACSAEGAAASAAAQVQGEQADDAGVRMSQGATSDRSGEPIDSQAAAPVDGPPVTTGHPDAHGPGASSVARQVAPRSYADRVPFPDSLTLRPIAVMRSPFRERHGTPRQGALDDRAAPEVLGEVHLLDHMDQRVLLDLVGFERIWLLSWMHLNNPAWSPTVRPPRGGQRRGVFATRSPHRPNPIALSCVRLLGIDGRVVQVAAHDLIDGTPIVDIKPYLPFADAFPDAAAGWVDALPRAPDGRPLGPRLKRS